MASKGTSIQKSGGQCAFPPDTVSLITSPSEQFDSTRTRHSCCEYNQDSVSISRDLKAQEKLTPRSSRPNALFNCTILCTKLLSIPPISRAPALYHHTIENDMSEMRPLIHELNIDYWSTISKFEILGATLLIGCACLTSETSPFHSQICPRTTSIGLFLTKLQYKYTAFAHERDCDIDASA